MLLFSGKLGAENVILIIIGILHLVIFAQRRQDLKKYHRLWLHLWEGVFFCGYGFLYDLYRYRVFLDYWILDLGFHSVLIWRMVVLFVLITPIYVVLIYDACILLLQKDPPNATPDDKKMD